MNPFPFAFIAWAAACLIICRWMAGAKAEDERFNDKHP